MGKQPGSPASTGKPGTPQSQCKNPTHFPSWLCNKILILIRLRVKIDTLMSMSIQWKSRAWRRSKHGWWSAGAVWNSISGLIEAFFILLACGGRYFAFWWICGGDQLQQYEHVGDSAEILTNCEVHWYHGDPRDQSYEVRLHSWFYEKVELKCLRVYVNWELTVQDWTCRNIFQVLPLDMGETRHMKVLILKNNRFTDIPRLTFTFRNLQVLL